MQTAAKKKPTVQPVKKPILIGSWHGKDAWKLAGKRAASVLLLSLLFLLAGMLLSFEALWPRILVGLGLVFSAAYYQYHQGLVRGENDAAFSEIMYVRQESGNRVAQTDRERCFHPAKGFFATLVGALPFVLLALVFACLTKPVVYSLGVLPSWMSGVLQQSEMADALAYYNAGSGIGVVDVLRVLVRAMIMPFVGVASYWGEDATLLAERLSPLLVLITPIAYALGYMRGPEMRTRINTGIKIGDAKKKKRERKARRQRQRKSSNTPERLI